MLQIAHREESAKKADWLIYGGNLEPLVSQPPLLSCEVSVIVPVRNEAENIEAMLQALANQTDLEGKPLGKDRYEIIVLANNCSDHSADLARRFAQANPKLTLHVVEITLPSSEAYVGRVRKILMDEAYRRMMSNRRDRGIIASTDGDSQVAPTWIAATLAEINQGADAVGGRIITNQIERLALDSVTRKYFLRSVAYQYLSAQLESYIDPYPGDRLPRHHQHYGASLAVTAQMYGRVGGLPPVRSPEDVAFYRALLRYDARFRHSPAVRVVTSARQFGRTNVGLANRLNHLAAMGSQHQPVLVESALVVETRFRVRRQLRRLWWREQNFKKVLPNSLIILANNLGISTDWLADAISMSPTFGLLVERVEQHQQQLKAFAANPELVPIEQANRKLRDRLRQLDSSFSPLISLEQIKPIFLLAPSF